MTVSDDNCVTCNQPHPWSDGTVPKHPFNDGTAQSTAWLGPRRDRDQKTSQRGPERPSWPIDPVLRQALIDKGVLTPQDLRDAEEKIRAVTAQFEGSEVGWSVIGEVSSDWSTGIGRTFTGL
jgi:hypothetical protein